MEQKITNEFLQKLNITFEDIAEGLLEGQGDFVKEINFNSKEKKDSDLIECFFKNEEVDRLKIVLAVVMLRIVIIHYVLHKFIEVDLSMKIVSKLSDLYLSMLKYFHPKEFDAVDSNVFFEELNEMLEWWKQFLIKFPDLKEEHEKFDVVLYRSFCEKEFGEVYRDLSAMMLFGVMQTSEMTGTHDFCEGLLNYKPSK